MLWILRKESNTLIVSTFLSFLILSVKKKRADKNKKKRGLNLALSCIICTLLNNRHLRMIEDIRYPLGAVFIAFREALCNPSVDTASAKLKINIAQLLS